MKMGNHLLLLLLVITPCFTKGSTLPLVYNTRLHKLKERLSPLASQNWHCFHHVDNFVNNARIRKVLRRIFLEENKRKAAAGKLSFKSNKSQFYRLVGKVNKGKVQENQKSEKRYPNKKFLETARKLLTNMDRTWFNRIH